MENETFNNLLNLLNLKEYQIEPTAETLINTNARYIKDLKINVSKVLNNTQFLSSKETILLAYAVAVNEKNNLLKESFVAKAEETGITQEELAEVISLTSLMNVNNIYYRFRHFANKDFYNNQPAGY